MGPRIYSTRMFSDVADASGWALEFEIHYYSCHVSEAAGHFHLLPSQICYFYPHVQMLFVFHWAECIYEYFLTSPETAWGMIIYYFFSEELSISFNVSCEMTFDRKYVLSKSENILKDRDLRMKAKRDCLITIHSARKSVDIIITCISSQ